jgi:transcriptional regulator with XRE-family HTH domain
MRNLRTTARENLRGLRRSRGLTQQDLVVRLRQLGVELDRSSIAKVEAGKRELTLTETFAVAWALDVAPIHLLVPIDGDEPIEIGPKMQASPAEVRAWIRGQSPLFQDPRRYYTAVPTSELDAAGEALARFHQAAPIAVTTNEEEQ